MVARKPTDVVQVNLRLRESLRRKLEREAEKRGVSFNSELIRRLEASFDLPEMNAFMREALWQAFASGGLTEAMKPIVKQIIEDNAAVPL